MSHVSSTREESAVDGVATEVQQVFVHGELPVAVHGLGKMGLPLAAAFAEVCGNVTGVDTDPSVVDTVNAGDCHVKNEPELPSLVDDLVTTGALTVTADGVQAAIDSRIHVVIIPTPITSDRQPDLSILDAVIDTIGTGLDAGDIVLIESTVPPGTTQERVLPQLCEWSGLEPGDFALAFCPERTSSGRALRDIRGAYPKVVGGVDEESTRVAAAIYETINDAGVIPTADATTAEAVKVFEGLYRDVNIALANELGSLTDDLGIDVREAIDVANTQPFCDLHDPGPGVGGHCIPYYPYFVIDTVDGPTELLETARAVNDAMPAYTVGKLAEEFEAEGNSLEGSSVLLLGLTYRPGVEEVRASPAIPIASELSDRGAEVYGVDPMLDDFDAFDIEPLAHEDIYSREFDGVVLVTPHDEFERIRWDDLGAPSGSLVVIDGRDALDVDAAFPHRVYTLGSG